ncbi:GNAT family N-acetyltransferase [Flexivirga caeni]|uniref:GNAT family N-acetyltransferase n=1 Tax=Flexivirga caeni TaxID=2294115 RepID=A0A3M9LVD3_9MICO|nr:GNAT family N-acetyltransferase [Flexivirga caeni]RNI17286.1 GNAT family N-acetyltransferase [Flexivirga caeni]
MARSAVQVTRVTYGDEDSFVQLWRDSKLADGHTEDQIDRALREGRLTRACERPDVRIFAASVDGDPVGFTIVMSGPVSALQDTLAVWVDVLWVRPGRRQRGVAGALLQAVATYAEHIGAPEIVSCVPSASRDANRFFARLGFASVVTERMTTPAALHRRLAGPGAVVGEAVRRRRTLRARTRRHEVLTPAE